MSLPKIFINYRIKDTRYPADILYAFLKLHFPEGSLFMDVNDIDEGVYWDDTIEQRLDQADVLLVLIGDQWETAIREKRQANKPDWVLHEINDALGRKDKLVLPVLFDRDEPVFENFPEVVPFLRIPSLFPKLQAFKIQRENREFGEQKILTRLQKHFLELKNKHALAEEEGHEHLETRKELRDLKNRFKVLQAEKEQLERELRKSNRKYTRQITELENTLAEKNKTIEELEADITQAMSTIYDLKNKPETELNIKEDLKPYQETVNGVTFKMMPVKGGSFMMGSENDSDSKPIHEVNLQSFYMAETQVTQELYEAVMGRNPSLSRSKQSPVERVSWKGAQQFCETLTKI